jgi:hypothetical protein
LIPVVGLVLACLALAGCGGPDASAPRVAAPKTAKECADRWNEWTSTLESSSSERRQLNTSLKGIESPVTVIARRGDDPGSAYCGVALWLTHPSLDGDNKPDGRLWASADDDTQFALNSNPLTEYPASADGDEVADYEILWDGDLGGTWRDPEASAPEQAVHDPGESAAHSAPTSTSEADAAAGAGAGEIMLNANWSGSDGSDPASLEVRPDFIGVGSAVWYSGLRWSGWGSKRAVGKGLKHWGGCGACAEDPDSPAPVTLVASKPRRCQGVSSYSVVLVNDPSGESFTMRFRCRETAPADPANPIYEQTVRASGLSETELEAFFQRTVERGRAYARTYGDYATAQAACGELVRSFANRELALSILEGDVVVTHLRTMQPARQIAALVALAQVAAQGCDYGVGAELSGS